MAGKRLEIEIGVDASDGIKGVRQFSKAVSTELGKVEDEFDDTATAGQKVAKALSNIADTMDTELKGAAKAAQALKTALGDIGDKSDTTQIVADLKRMGLTFEQIEADADALATSLKKIDGVQLDDVNDRSRRAKGGIDDLGKSADSSKSVLANMVGNATQDLGALGGLAGSAGVAIGQMGEYMADAAADGDNFGQIVGNFSKVLGPIGALTVGVALVTGVMGELKTQSEESAKRVEDFGEAMKTSAIDTVGFAQVLRENADELENFSGVFTGVNSAIDDFAGKVGSKIPAVGKFFTDTTTDLIDVANRAGLSFYDLSKRIENGSETTTEFAQKLIAAKNSGAITAREFNALSDAMGQYGGEAEDARLKTEALNRVLAVSAEEANALLQTFELQTNPMAHFTLLWDTLMDDIRDGTIDTEVAAQAINVLAETLGLLPEQVIALAKAKLDEELDDTTVAAKKATAAFGQMPPSMDEIIRTGREMEQKLKDDAEAIRDASDAVKDLSRATRGIQTDALKDMFDFGNGPERSAAAVRDIELALKELPDKLKDVKVGEVLANSIKADDFLDAMDSLAPQIQAQVSDAFALGGPEAAIATAAAYVDQVVKELGGKFSRDEIVKMLGFENLFVTIGVALDEAALQTAKTTLEILTGLPGGQTPYTASIAVALNAGTITPQAAQLLFNEALRDAGVKVPATFQTDPAVLAEAVAFANSFFGDNPATVTTEADTEGAKTDITTDVTDVDWKAEVDTSALTTTARADIAAIENGNYTATVDVDANTAKIEADIRRVKALITGPIASFLGISTVSASGNMAAPTAAPTAATLAPMAMAAPTVATAMGGVRNFNITLNTRANARDTVRELDRWTRVNGGKR